MQNFRSISFGHLKIDAVQKNRSSLNGSRITVLRVTVSFDFTNRKTGVKIAGEERLRILSLVFIGKESILFVVLEHFQDLQKYGVPLDTIMRMRRWLSEKLTLIPNAKLVIVSGLERWKAEQLPRETFGIYYNSVGRELTMATLLELLNKRWQTLDLVSVMQELQRILIIKKTPQYKLIEGKSVRFSLSKDVDIFDNLSCLPRLQKKE